MMSGHSNLCTFRVARANHTGAAHWLELDRLFVVPVLIDTSIIRCQGPTIEVRVKFLERAPH